MKVSLSRKIRLRKHGYSSAAQRHRHAARATAGPAQFAALQKDQVFLPVQQVDVWIRKQFLRRQHVITIIGELFGGGHVAAVTHDDARCQGKGIGAIGPLLPLLHDVVVAAAKDGL